MILLDTHVLLWLALDRDRLKQSVLSRIADAVDQGMAHLSAASLWEVATLHRRRRINLGCPLRDWIDLAVGVQGFQIVPINTSIAVEAGSLPDEIHGDPGDRMIIATARVRQLELMTADRDILRYVAAGHVKAVDARR